MRPADFRIITAMGEWKMSRSRAIKTALIAVTLCFTLTAHATAEPPKPVNVPAGPLVPALESLSKQMTVQLIYEPKQLRPFRTGGVSGTHTARDAIRLLLEGTPLVVKMDPTGAMAIIPPKSDSQRSNFESGASANPSTTSMGDGKGGKKQSSGTFRVAKVAQAASERSNALANGSVTESTALQEIVVTADKVSEPIMDVPMSLTALSGNALERMGSYRFQDYAGLVPGLTVIGYGALGDDLVIRGVTSGDQPVNGSVAVYLDETPFTIVGAFAGSGFNTPDLDTFDMQRIEVLRGPQGTLYGANSLAGVLKYVTNPPDPNAFNARFELGGNSVYDGVSGFEYHAMLNIPLSRDTALRVVAYDNYYPGFIDDPFLGRTDVNGSHVSGSRVSALYEPNSDISFRLNALYQKRSWGAYPSEDVNPITLVPVYGRLIQNQSINQSGTTTNELYNLTVKLHGSGTNLLSSTSYSAIKPQNTIDESTFFRPLLTKLFGVPYGLAILYNSPLHAITQELRLSSLQTSNLRWMAGGYFTNEDSYERELAYPLDPSTNQIVYNFSPDLGGFLIPTGYREYAGFANVDYFITKSFDVNLGGRYSSTRETFHETAPGLFGRNANFGEKSSGNVTTYSLDVRWHVTSTNMLYARVATGYAPGGPNDIVATENLPLSYSSSTTTNYETGVKTSILDGRIRSSVDGFLINWNRIQLIAAQNGLSSIVSGGGARSTGAEWDLAIVPVPGLTVDVNGAYTHAVLTAETPASVGGHKGDPLPGAPRWELSANARYERPIFRNTSGFISASWRYNGSRYAQFEASSPRQEMPGFNIVDARVGVDTQRWSFALYVDNITNDIAVNYLIDKTPLAGAGTQSAILYTPRTIGISVTFSTL